MHRITSPELLVAGAIAFGASADVAQANPQEPLNTPSPVVATINNPNAPTPDANFSMHGAASPHRLPAGHGEAAKWASINSPTQSVREKILASCAIAETTNFSTNYGYVDGSSRRMHFTITTAEVSSDDPDGRGPEMPVPCDGEVDVAQTYRPLLEVGGHMVTNGPEFSEASFQGKLAITEDDSFDGASARTLAFSGIKTARAYTCAGTREDDSFRSAGMRIKTVVKDAQTGDVLKVVVERQKTPDFVEDEDGNVVLVNGKPVRNNC